jgi:acyl carrier protein
MGVRNLGIIALEQPALHQLEGLAALGDTVSVAHVDRAACAASIAIESGGASPLRCAVAAMRELMPPLGSVLHAPLPAEAAAAAAEAVKQAQAAAVPAARTSVQPYQQPTLATNAAKPAVDANAVRQAVIAAVGALLGDPAASSIGEDEPLMSAGLTSTLAVQLTQQLEESLSLALPGTLVFDYPSINEMVGFLAAELASKSSSAAQKPTSTAAPEPASRVTPLPQRAATTAPRPAPAARQQQLEAGGAALVLQHVAQLLGSDAAGTSADAPLMSAGLTSTLAVQLTQLLEQAVGAELPGTLVFDYPSAAEIGAFLAAQGLLSTSSLTAAAAPPQAAAPASVEAGPRQRQQVAAQVLREAASLLGSDVVIRADEPLMSAGLTSTLAVQLVGALEAAVGAELPGTLIFDYPTGTSKWWFIKLLANVRSYQPRVLTPLVAASDIADYFISEGLVPAALASLAAPAALAPAALAVAQVCIHGAHMVELTDAAALLPAEKSPPVMLRTPCRTHRPPHHYAQLLPRLTASLGGAWTSSARLATTASAACLWSAGTSNLHLLTTIQASTGAGRAGCGCRAWKPVE